MESKKLEEKTKVFMDFIHEHGYTYQFAGGGSEDWWAFKRPDGVYEYWNGDLTERIDK